MCLRPTIYNVYASWHIKGNAICYMSIPIRYHFRLFFSLVSPWPDSGSQSGVVTARIGDVDFRRGGSGEQQGQISRSKKGSRWKRDMNGIWHMFDQNNIVRSKLLILWFSTLLSALWLSQRILIFRSEWDIFDFHTLSFHK